MFGFLKNVFGKFLVANNAGIQVHPAPQANEAGDLMDHPEPEPEHRHAGWSKWETPLQPRKRQRSDVPPPPRPQTRIETLNVKVHELLVQNNSLSVRLEEAEAERNQHLEQVKAWERRYRCLNLQSSKDLERKERECLKLQEELKGVQDLPDSLKDKQVRDLTSANDTLTQEKDTLAQEKDMLTEANEAMVKTIKEMEEKVSAFINCLKAENTASLTQLRKVNMDLTGANEAMLAQIKCVEDYAGQYLRDIQAQHQQQNQEICKKHQDMTEINEAMLAKINAMEVEAHQYIEGIEARHLLTVNELGQQLQALRGNLPAAPTAALASSSTHLRCKGINPGYQKKKTKNSTMFGNLKAPRLTVATVVDSPPLSSSHPLPAAPTAPSASSSTYQHKKKTKNSAMFGNLKAPRLTVAAVVDSPPLSWSHPLPAAPTAPSASSSTHLRCNAINPGYQKKKTKNSAMFGNLKAPRLTVATVVDSPPLSWSHPLPAAPTAPSASSSTYQHKKKTKNSAMFGNLKA